MFLNPFSFFFYYYFFFKSDSCVAPGRSWPSLPYLDMCELCYLYSDCAAASLQSSHLQTKTCLISALWPRYLRSPSWCTVSIHITQNMMRRVHRTTVCIFRPLCFIISWFCIMLGRSQSKGQSSSARCFVTPLVTSCLLPCQRKL